MKSELTNEKSAGGKNFTVRRRHCKKGIEIGQMYSLEMALNSHE